MTPGRGAPPRPGLRGLPLAALALLPLPAGAQEAGLPALVFDLSPRLEADLSGGGASAVTGLAFSLLDATPTSRLSLAAEGSIRLDGEARTFSGPSLSFGYERDGAGESLTASATLSRTEVDDATDLSDFVGEDGVIVLPPDFEALEGEGTRREASAEVALALRQDRPLGVTLSAGATRIAYEDASSPDLVDSLRLRFGLGLTARLGGGRTASATLRYATLDEEGADLSETWGLDLGAAAERPRGPLSASLSFERTEGQGLRVSASLGRTLAFPTGALSASLGLSRGEDGDLFPTASLQLRRETPQGTLSLSLAQALRAGEDDGEELATTLSARFDRALTPRLGLTLDALYAATDPTGEGEATREAELGAAARYALTPAWGLDAGLRASRDEDGEDDVTAFLGLSRRFEGTF